MVYNTLHDRALKYHAEGWSVIPIEEKGKKPLIPWKEYQTRRATRDEVNSWWERWPNANIGIVTGKISGLVVVDLDGQDSVDYVEQKGWPTCPTVSTGKGLHLYFAYPNNNEIGNTVGFDNVKGLDIRGDGGYVVAPPSIHPSGVIYVWANKAGNQLPELPSYFIPQTKNYNNNKRKINELLQGVSEGERNISAARLAGHWFAMKLEPDEVLKRLVEWNSKNKPSLPEDELLRVFESIKTREMKKRKDDLDETDIGNALVFKQLYGDDFRYCYDLKQWFSWDNTIWLKCHIDDILECVEDVIKHIRIMASIEEDEQARKRLMRQATRLGKKPGAESMLYFAQGKLSVDVKEFDAKPMVLNCLNGTLDLKTGELYPHRREDLLTRKIPANYDPSAKCPRWEAFLDRIMSGNKNLIEFLQRAVGYSLTEDVSEQVLFILYGTGANGKGVFLSTILYMLSDYGKFVVPELLLAERGEHPTVRADLYGARMAVTAETDEGKRLNEGLVKWLTGGDMLKARFMRQDYFSFKPTHKLWLATNHKPIIRGTDNGIWRRIRLIPFEVTIPVEEQDKHLTERLCEEEIDGILAWAVRGCLEWQRVGLGEPSEVKEATTGYRKEMDVLAQFIEDECIVDPKVCVKSSDLFRVYTQWCLDNGEHALSQRNLGIRLKERGFSPERKNHGERWWAGIGLRGDK